MPPQEHTLRVRNYREMQRAFKAASRKLNRELRQRLRKVAEPVRSDAQSKASSKIRNIGPRWNRMRTGVTSRVVYVAPRERGRASRANVGLRRKNLAGLLMERAMAPALAENTGEIVHGVEDLLDDVGREWEHTR